MSSCEIPRLTDSWVQQWRVVPTSMRSPLSPTELSSLAFTVHEILPPSQMAPSFSFGSIRDASVDESGNVYLIDGEDSRVVVIDPSGETILDLRARGTGPGEMLAPFRIAVTDSGFVVYDLALRRITFFRLDGTLETYFSFELGRPSELLVLDPDTLVLVTAGGSRQFVAVTFRGAVLDSALAIPPGEREGREPQGITRGRACLDPKGTIVYVSPYIYEMISFDWPTRASTGVIYERPRHMPQYPGDGRRRARTNAVPLGLSCTERFRVNAFMDPMNRTVYYDVFGPTGEPVGRIVARDESALPAASIAGGHDDRLVLYQNRGERPRLFRVTIQVDGGRQ